MISSQLGSIDIYVTNPMNYRTIVIGMNNKLFGN